MSLSALSTASKVLPTVNFHPHGHHKGAATAAASATSGGSGGLTIGQLPVGAASPLFSNILQSLQQTVGAQAATVAPAPAPAGGTAASAAVTATASTASASASSAAGLKTLLSNLLVNVQHGGVHALSGVGNNLDTNV